MQKLLLFLLLLLPLIVYAQKNKDPFARSRRLPDFSLGTGVMYNLEPKFRVRGMSAILQTDFYFFDKRFSIGAEATTNLTRIQQSTSAALTNRGILNGLVYNHLILGLRGGYIFRDNLIFTIGLGIESLEQFRHYKRNGQTQFDATGKMSRLFYYKTAILYRYKTLVYEAFYSRRGFGLGCSYYFGY